MCIKFIVWKMFCIFSKFITLEKKCVCVYVSSHLHIRLVTKNPHSSSKVGPRLAKWGPTTSVEVVRVKTWL